MEAFILPWRCSTVIYGWCGGKPDKWGLSTLCSNCCLCTSFGMPIWKKKVFCNNKVQTKTVCFYPIHRLIEKKNRQVNWVFKKSLLAALFVNSEGGTKLHMKNLVKLFCNSRKRNALSMVCLTNTCLCNNAWFGMLSSLLLPIFSSFCS